MSKGVISVLKREEAKKFYDLLNEIMEIVKKFPVEMELKGITKELLDKGFRRFEFVLAEIVEIESKGKIKNKTHLMDPDSLSELTNNFRWLLEAIVNAIESEPGEKIENKVADLIAVWASVVRLGKIEEGIFLQLLNLTNFRTFIAAVHDTAGYALPDDYTEDLKGLMDTIFDIKKTGKNQFKEIILLISFIEKFVNEPFKLKNITEVILQDSAGFFMANTPKNWKQRLTSYIDMSLKLKENGVFRFIRVEFKAWVNMSYQFEADGITPKIIAIDAQLDKKIRDLAIKAQDDFCQVYKYLFESIFIYRDMQSMMYVIPESVNSTGITATMIQNVQNYFMNADAAALMKLLYRDGKLLLTSPNDATGVNLLAKLALESAEKEGDFRFVNIMKHWDRLIDELDPEEPELYGAAKKFVSEGKSITDVHTEMAGQLRDHFAKTDNVVGCGILRVSGSLGAE